MWLLQDYPSVGQIAYELDRSKKFVIFAVSKPVYPEYQRLQTQVPRSSANILQTGKDSNVVQIVRDTYRVCQSSDACESPMIVYRVCDLSFSFRCFIR